MVQLRARNREVHLSEAQARRQTRRTREVIIGEKITPDANGCWIYGDREDYSTVVGNDGRWVPVHRFVYETLVGPIPKRHHLHHLCETPGCCNPDHLEPLTPREHAAAHR